MADHKETVGRTLGVAFAVCLVCSIFVAGAAVSLKPLQQQNALLDKQRSILRIAGMTDGKMSGAEVRTLFDQSITPRLIDMESGQFSDALDPYTFDPTKAADDPKLSDKVPADEDIASIRRIERYSVAYMVEKDGQLDTLILPVRGYGLWSTLYGFIALGNDLETVRGFGFYQHAETPGLGGEVDNPRWLSQWPGKRVYDDDGKLDIAIIKGNVDPNNPQADHQVDAIAGATLTSRGVQNLLQFWLGPNGFKPFLQNLKNGEA
jgi:Na+-transporting NADH:ubiquinone oxidoreductase subunit C